LPGLKAGPDNKLPVFSEEINPTENNSNIVILNKHHSHGKLSPSNKRFLIFFNLLALFQQVIDILIIIC
jgi:hypothetical protein